MASYILTVLFFFCVVLASVCHADVSSLRYNNRYNGRLTTQLQRQQQSAAPTPYPAAGFRPDRPFAVQPRDKQQFQPQPQRPEIKFDNASPNQQVENEQRPDLTYVPPARLRQFASAALQQAISQRQQVYAAPQRTYGAPEAEAATNPDSQVERLTALKSSRLIDNREDREDEDDAASASDIEVDTKTEEKKTFVAAPTQPATTNFAYYPAGAVSFVHPLAAYIQSANYYAQLQAQPATAAYVTAAAGGSTAAAAPTTAPSAALIQPPIYATSPYLQQFAYAAAPAAQLQAW